MSILSLSQLIGTNARGIYQLGDNVRNVVNKISAAATSSSAAPQDSTSVSAQNLQAKLDGFREAAQEIARNVGELSLAARGTDEIEGKLSELKTLASQALQNPQDEKSLNALNEAVKKIRTSIDQTAQKSQFAAPQADTKEGTEAAGQPDSIPAKLGSEALLGAKIELSSAADIRNLLATVQNASGKLSVIQDDIKSLFERFESVAVHLEVSMENQIAANSTLPAGDALNALEALLGNPNMAAAAQSSRMPGELLNLI